MEIFCFITDQKKKERKTETEKWEKSLTLMKLHNVFISVIYLFKTKKSDPSDSPSLEG